MDRRSLLRHRNGVRFTVSMPPPSTQPLRILWLKSGPVTPPNTGGRLRSFQTLRALHQEHEVSYLALGAAEPDDGTAYATNVEFVPHKVPVRGSLAFALRALRNLCSSQPLALSLYESTALTRRISDLVATKPFDVIVCDFLTLALCVPEALRGRCVLFQHNMEAQIWERMAANATSPIKRAYLRSQHRRMLRWEQRLSAQFKTVITVSAADSEIARSQYGLTNVAGHVPTGVDAESFRALNEVPRDLTKVCFLGSMDWLPNIDGMTWFLNEAWPTLHARRPEVRLIVIGRNPPAALRAAWDGKCGVQFTGTVDDVRRHLAGCAAAVVPLRIGGGTRLKILELMAAGIPVVSTTIGAEGLPLQHERHFLCADEPGALGSALERLLTSSAAASAMVERSLTEIVQPNSWQHCAGIFLQLAMPGESPPSYSSVATKQPAISPPCL